MKLIYDNIQRIESDQSVIDNLVRKGWSIVIEPQAPILPPQPEYDRNVERLIFNTNEASWNIIPLTQEELEQRQREQIIMDNMIAKAQVAETIRQGFTVQPENYVLGLGDLDRIAFSQMLTLVKEALDLNLIDNDTPQTIADADGVKHTVTTLRFRQIMVEYGFYYKNLWDQLN